ncbi:MAG: hypothetical protein ACOYVK_05915 [Bacillota bacterium]
MTAFFYVLFGIGTLYTVITFLLGNLLDFMDLDFDGDLDVDGFGNMQVAPFKPIIIAAFLTSFGGFGLVFQHKGLWGPFLTIIFALLPSLLISALLYYFVLIPLYKIQRLGNVADQQSLIGCRAKVTIPIRDNRYGKITYIVNGNTYSAPARTYGEREFKAGEEVTIIDIQKNVYIVDDI